MNRFLLSLLIGLGLLAQSTVHAATIYNQTTPDEPSAAFGSSEGSVSQKIADNFLFVGSNPVTIRSLRFIGTEIASPLLDNFRVVFLEDAGGSPGSPLVGGDFSIGGAFSSTPTGGQLLNGVGTPLEYVINLPSGVAVDSNTVYWISITNDLLPASGWGWARANGEFDQTIASTTGTITSGPWSTLNNGGMWFELNDHVVPEPSSLAVLVLCVTFLALSRSWQISRTTC